MDKEVLKRRCKDAESVSNRLDRILRGMNRLPDFKGKAALMDRINDAKMEAHNLSWELKRELDRPN